MIGTSYLDLTSARLHFGHDGTPGNPSVLLLHGWPDLWFTWEGQMTKLVEQGYYVVAPDQRGYGRSSKPSQVGDYALDLAVEDMVQLIERLALAPVHIVGHDWGAMVAWRLAAARPELVRTLTVVNAPHPSVFIKNIRKKPTQLLRSAHMFAFQIPGIEALLSARDSALQLAILREAAKITDPALLQRYREAWREPGAISRPLYWYRALLRSLAESSVRTSHAIRVPTHVLWGNNDPFFVPGTAEQCAKRCKIAEITLLDAGHWPFHERPDAFSAAMLSYLAKHTPELKGDRSPSGSARMLH